MLNRTNSLGTLLSNEECIKIISIMSRLQGNHLKVEAQENLKKFNIETANATLKDVAKVFTENQYKDFEKEYEEFNKSNYIKNILQLNEKVDPKDKFSKNTLVWVFHQSVPVIYAIYLQLELSSVYTCIKLSDIEKRNKKDDEVKKSNIVSDEIKSKQAEYHKNVIAKRLSEKGLNIEDVDNFVGEVCMDLFEDTLIEDKFDNDTKNYLFSSIVEESRNKIINNKHNKDIDFHYFGIAELESGVNEDSKETLSLDIDYNKYTVKGILDCSDFMDTIVNGKKVLECLEELGIKSDDDIENFICTYFDNFNIDYTNSVKMINMRIVLETILEEVKKYLVLVLMQKMNSSGLKNPNEVEEDEMLDKDKEIVDMQFERLVEADFVNGSNYRTDFASKAEELFDLGHIVFMINNYELIGPFNIFKTMNFKTKKEINDMLETFDELTDVDLIELRKDENSFDDYSKVERICYEYLLPAEIKQRLDESFCSFGSYYTMNFAKSEVDKALRKLESFISEIDYIDDYDG